MVPLYEIGLFGAMTIYLFATGRYMKNRVDVCLWFAIGLTMLFLALDRRQSAAADEQESGAAREGAAQNGAAAVPAGRTPSAALISIMLLASLTAANLTNAEGTKPLWRWSHDAQYEQSAWHEYTNRVKILAADADHLYVSKIALITGIYGGDPLTGPEVGIMKNLVYLGGWTNYGSVYNQTLAHYGVENPYKDLIDNEKVYLVDNDINLTLEYLRVHYNPDVEAEKVMDVGPNPVWRIVTKSGKSA